MANPTVVSLLSSDDEDDAPVVSGIKRKLRPMPVHGKYSNIGASCAKEAMAVRQLQAVTKRAFDNLYATTHSDYATQIQDKDDEIARLREGADDKQMCIDDSMTEIDRLRAELMAQQTKATNSQQVVMDLIAELHRSASSAAAPATILKSGQEILESILGDVKTHLVEKEISLLLKLPLLPGPDLLGCYDGSPCVDIMQGFFSSSFSPTSLQ